MDLSVVVHMAFDLVVVAVEKGSTMDIMVAVDHKTLVADRKAVAGCKVVANTAAETPLAAVHNSCQC